MAIINPEHLLEQAYSLATTASNAGRPRQADLRRSISSAYYAVFHAVVTAAADLVIGQARRNTPAYALVVRSIDHRTIRATCLEVLKPTQAASYRPYIPVKGFKKQIPRLAAAFPNLQELRHAADYDTARSFTTSDARGAVASARSALRYLNNANPEARRAFLLLILFPPRNR